MGRKRVLSEEGQKLFNVSLKKPMGGGCIKTILRNLFTSDFDTNLDASSEQMRKASMKLYSYLNKKERKSIPELIDHAIVNIILLIMLTDNKINNLQRVKYNIHYYTHLAKRAHNEGDHHTAILIKAALENTALRRLKLKTNKGEKKILQKLEEDYGTFMNCNSQHLRNILSSKEEDIENFLPSIMVLLMHLDKTHAYTKSYKQMGLVSDRLINIQYQLTQIVEDYYSHYKNFKVNLVELYLQNPLDHEIMMNQPSKSITTKLYDISYKILPANKKSTTLKRTKNNRSIITYHKN
jgi:hypothetical protein